MFRLWLPLLVTGCLNVILAKHKIHIGCLIPSYGQDNYGYQTAIELAAEMINNRTDILPDHEIVMLCGDTFVSIRKKVFKGTVRYYMSLEDIECACGKANENRGN